MARAPTATVAATQLHRATVVDPTGPQWAAATRLATQLHSHESLAADSQGVQQEGAQGPQLHQDLMRSDVRYPPSAVRKNRRDLLN